MINKLWDVPSFSLFNNFEVINKMKNKINEVVDAVNGIKPAPVPTPTPTPTPEYQHDYSFDEKEIGIWVDGKILYEKTFKIEHPNFDKHNPIDAVDVSSLGIDFAFISNVIQDNSERDETEHENHASMLPVGNMSWGFAFSGTIRNMIWGVNRSVIRVYCSQDTDFINLNFYVTIQYTKLLV